MGDFRVWLDSKEKDQKIKNLLDGHDLIFFFTMGDEIFAAPEESRVVFAKMKTRDEDANWIQDANFAAFNMLQALLGQKTQNIFSSKDIKKIKIIEKDEAEKLLKKHPSSKKDPLGSTKKSDIGMIKLKDKK